MCQKKLQFRKFSKKQSEIACANLLKLFRRLCIRVKQQRTLHALILILLMHS